MFRCDDASVVQVGEIMKQTHPSMLTRQSQERLARVEEAAERLYEFVNARYYTTAEFKAMTNEIRGLCTLARLAVLDGRWTEQ